MHDDEVLATPQQVRDLVASQHPKWADLPLTRLDPTGTDHLLYRLGEDLVVRLPRIVGAVEQVDADRTWLPIIAALVPCVISTPVAVGEPGGGYPYPWAIHSWLPGVNPVPGDHRELARELAHFVTALSRIDVGPVSSRPGPLVARDEPTRVALGALNDEIDVAAALRVWEDAVAAPEHVGPPVFRHADLLVGNLLVQNGHLSAVIDFGPSGLGDPAVDLQPAWAVFTGQARACFLDAVGADAAGARRGRGWTLSTAALALAYYRDRAPALAAGYRRTLHEVLLP